ncbi:hypothetical protein Hanom_Chr13g01189571 [Helianthus anomalus]
MHQFFNCSYKAHITTPIIVSLTKLLTTVSTKDPPVERLSPVRSRNLKSPRSEISA